MKVGLDLLVVTTQGAANPQALQSFTALFAQYPVKVLEIYYQTMYQVESTIYVLELQGETPGLGERIQENAKSHQLHAACHAEAASGRLSLEHSYILTLLSRHLSSETLSRLFAYIAERGWKIKGVAPLDYENLHVFEIKLSASQAIDRQQVMADLLDFKMLKQLDLALQPDTPFRKNKRLIVFDADMTFIQCEVINELSRMAGKEAEVEAITHRAMNGEMEFAQALRERVAMLKGLTIEQLQSLLDCIPYTPGVSRLVGILKRLGFKIALVSGGFSFFIEPICQRFQLDYGYANTLEIVEGRLTGGLLGEIVDAQGKARLLQQIAQQEDIDLQQVIAVGDGANDLYMLSCAGLGIAFNAKRFLQERATGSLSQPNLDALLYFLGISSRELEFLDQSTELQSR